MDRRVLLGLLLLWLEPLGVGMGLIEDLGKVLEVLGKVLGPGVLLGNVPEAVDIEALSLGKVLWTSQVLPSKVAVRDPPLGMFKLDMDLWWSLMEDWLLGFLGGLLGGLESLSNKFLLILGLSLGVLVALDRLA